MWKMTGFMSKEIDLAIKITIFVPYNPCYTDAERY